MSCVWKVHSQGWLIFIDFDYTRIGDVIDMYNYGLSWIEKNKILPNQS